MPRSQLRLKARALPASCEPVLVPRPRSSFPRRGRRRWRGWGGRTGTIAAGNRWQERISPAKKGKSEGEIRHLWADDLYFQFRSPLLLILKPWASALEVPCFAPEVQGFCRRSTRLLSQKPPTSGPMTGTSAAEVPCFWSDDRYVRRGSALLFAGSTVLLLEKRPTSGLRSRASPSEAPGFRLGSPLPPTLKHPASLRLNPSRKAERPAPKSNRPSSGKLWTSPGEPQASPEAARAPPNRPRRSPRLTRAPVKSPRGSSKLRETSSIFVGARGKEFREPGKQFIEGQKAFGGPGSQFYQRHKDFRDRAFPFREGQEDFDGGLLEFIAGQLEFRVTFSEFGGVWAWL